MIVASLTHCPSLKSYFLASVLKIYAVYLTKIRSPLLGRLSARMRLWKQIPFVLEERPPMIGNLEGHIAIFMSDLKRTKRESSYKVFCH